MRSWLPFPPADFCVSNSTSWSRLALEHSRLPTGTFQTCAVMQWHSGAVAQWCSGTVARSSGSRLRESEFESCAAVSSSFTLHCSSSLSCMNEYLVVKSGGYLCTISLWTLIAEWLDATKRSRDGVWLNRTARE